MTGSEPESLARSMLPRRSDNRASWRRSAGRTFLRRLRGGSLRLLTLGALLAAYASSSCSSSGSAVDAGADAAETGGACMVSASSYSQSCVQDTDCVEVTSTNYCNAEACLCGGSAINMSALAQFNADVATTPLGLHPGGGGCPCGSSFGPCCRQGTCTAECYSPTDTLSACADAGGTCVLSAFAMCGNHEVPDACAYSDETCCAN
jgi:hypothetical protein